MGKIIFSEKLIRLADSGKQVHVRRQVRNLILSILWHEDFHWMDGFLIFETWRTKEQKGNYLQQFRSIASKASSALKELGLYEVKIKPNNSIDYQEYWRFKKKPNSNIDEVVLLLRKAQEYFVKGDERAWDLINQAINTYNSCVDPRALCQTVFFADSVPKEKVGLDEIKRRIRSYRKALLGAIVKVGYKASKEDEKQRQGLNFHNVSDSLARWIIEIIQVNEFLDLAGKWAIPPSKIVEDVAEFARLAAALAEYKPKSQTRGDIDYGNASEMHQSIEDELDVNMLQEQLVECAFVKRIAIDIENCYQDRPWLMVKSKDVRDRLDSAIFDFARKNRNTLDLLETLERRFRKFLRRYVDDKDARKNLSLKMFDAPDKSLEEKREKLSAILKEIKRAGDIETSEVKRIAHLFESSKPSACREPRFECFQFAEQVLEIKHPSIPEWFRPLGPIFSDFEDQRVYRRTIVDTVKKKVLEKSVYLLEGMAATGKSVIVRYLMYELSNKGKVSRVYYFDVAQRRHFDEDQLIKEIQSATGIFIIENIHLEPYKIQWVYTRIKSAPEKDPERHVLFTSRILDEKLLDDYSKVLLEIEKTTIEPFEEVDKLVDFYCTHPKTPKIVSKMRNEIMEVSQKSFWLLAFALRGCDDANGKGEPISWIHDKVNGYLSNLENLDKRYDEHADYYPRILLALCPLYMSEVLTVEEFLINELDFPRPALKALAKRGEITQQKFPEGAVFYGLPHLALAEAYWEHGNKYRRELPEYEDFIFDYAASGMPNGLTAVVEADESVKDKVLSRLSDAGEFAKVMEKEKSLRSILTWLYEADCEILADKRTIDALTHDLENTEDTSLIPKCILAVYGHGRETGQSLWHRLNSERLEERIRRMTPMVTFILDLRQIQYVDAGVASTLCGMIDAKSVAMRLNKSHSIRVIGDCISTVFSTNREVGRQLWEALDKNDLKAKFGRAKDLLREWPLADIINSVDPEVASEICGLMGVKNIAKSLNREKSVWTVGWYVYVFLHTDQERGKELWQHLSKKTLATKISRAKNLEDVWSCINCIHSAEPSWSFELCKLLSSKKFARVIKMAGDEWGKRCLEIVGKANGPAREKLEKQLSNDNNKK